MHMTKVPGFLLVLLCCELCSSIKVPVTWEDSANSEVKNDPHKANPVPSSKPPILQVTRPISSEPMPHEYFEYTAKKPQFATDIAAFHGVMNPDQLYKGYPVRPFTGTERPVLGIHYMLDDDKVTYQQYQNYVQQNSEPTNHVKPTASNYEVFHPYKAEEPALREIYKDPVLTKIRNDLQDSKNRLQTYEHQAGEPNIANGEYLESPKKTEGKLFPHENVPARYEVHRPERRPLYYGIPVRDFNRNNLLNKKIKHPLNQNAKIKPMHYHPLHKHIHHLRQQHANKYDDERNEYPQVPISENIAEKEDGYDIYEKGKQKYIQLRNNLDESVNKVSQQNRAPNYQKLEIQKEEPKNEDIEEEFVPVKNYAQVRKTETIRHLPKNAAFDDAETYEEVINAPRLREAVKSTKAQTVYTEEGYEDSAYDHAGEQKHASDHEGHGGFLKEHENSGGLYKIPTVAGKYQDDKKIEYRDHIEHGKKWKNKDEDDDEESEEEDYFETEGDETVEAEIHKDSGLELGNRNKRQSLSYLDVNASDDDINNESDDEDTSDDESVNKSDSEGEEDMENLSTQTDTRLLQSDEVNVHQEVEKRKIKFKVPEINLDSTLYIKTGVPKHAKRNKKPKRENVKDKYPYYFKKLKGIHKNSPLRYAENLNFIPKKSNGGSEFYDSRSQFECPEVDSEVDPLPEKLKNGENPTDENDREKSKNKSFDTIKKQHRLKGLGDKIDCFKAKYFGENPLDSPFFHEDVISSPEPIVLPKLLIYKLNNTKGETAKESKIHTVTDLSDKLNETTNMTMDKLRNDQGGLQSYINNLSEKLKASLYSQLITQANNDTKRDTTKTRTDFFERSTVPSTRILNSNIDESNITYTFFQNKEDVTKLPPKLRKKRAFVYEPYKIIRDGQVQDSKKTTTTSNISPLIKQLQSSGVADRVSRSNKDDKQKSKIRTYVDIGKRERTKPSRNENDNSDATFVDVSVDHRRGEPRYELRQKNHKSEYAPVENIKAMSVDSYKLHRTTESIIDSTTPRLPRGKQRPWPWTSSTTTRPYDHLLKFNFKNTDIHNVAASNAVTNTVATASPKTVTEKQENLENDSEEDVSGEDYEEDEYDEAEDVTTTTTTTPKPLFRRRMKITRTEEKLPEHTTEAERLKLITRFRNYKPDENSETKAEADDIERPTYREKKKTSHARTVVTDTKKYGDEDDDDNMKKEVDAMIGVKHDMDEYVPMYEKEETDKEKLYRTRSEDNNNGDGDNDEDEDEDEDDDDDDDDDSSPEEEEAEKLDQEPEMTTPEPTKRTLVRTTDAPPSTFATRLSTTSPTVSSHIIRPETKPVITRKKIVIHKELPVNKSSPHVTQFKEDIKEVEIIKEMPALPRKKLVKNVLNLYKDDDLAKSINNLGDVEIFRDDFDPDRAPRHGGNYRQATKEDLRLPRNRESSTTRPKDAEPSQSENTKHVEVDEHKQKKTFNVNTKSLSDIKGEKNRGRSSELIDLSKPPVTGMHGGNLKHESPTRNRRRNEKLLELDEDYDEEHSSQEDDDYKSHGLRNEKMHGGNYRSAKLIAQDESNDDIQVKSATKNSRKSAAELLNSFAQAIPILTSTPGYIVDPSKRMYYYVDA